jgi:Ca2+-transporting ATPase
MFANGLALRIVLEGFMIGSLALLAFLIGFHYYDTPALRHAMQGNRIPNTYIPWVGRTMSFAVLSLSQLFHSFNMRSEHPLAAIGLFSNRKLVYSFVICTFLQMIVIMVPALAEVFQVVPLNLRQWAITLLLAIAPILIIETQKLLTGRIKKSNN